MRAVHLPSPPLWYGSHYLSDRIGDESGYKLGDVQKVKLAAIEAEWHTEPAPAAFTLFGLPNQKEGKTDYAIKIPYLMGLIATRSFDEQVTGSTIYAMNIYYAFVTEWWLINYLNGYRLVMHP